MVKHFIICLTGSKGLKRCSSSR